MTDAKEYLRLAKQSGNPVIESDLVTWVWEGNIWIYHTYHGGHNYPCWRDDLADGLIYHFGSNKSR